MEPIQIAMLIKTIFILYWLTGFFGYKGIILEKLNPEWSMIPLFVTVFSVVGYFIISGAFITGTNIVFPEVLIVCMFFSIFSWLLGFSTYKAIFINKYDDAWACLVLTISFVIPIVIIALIFLITFGVLFA